MKKNDLLKLIINSTKEDFSLEDIKELTGLKEEIELQDSNIFSTKKKEDSYFREENTSLKTSLENNDSIFPKNGKERVRFLPPFYVKVKEVTKDCNIGIDFLRYNPYPYVRDPDYLEVLGGKMHPMHFIKSKDNALRNYYIKSLRKTLRTNGNRITSKCFTGINSILQAFKNGTHEEYLREMNKRLCYVLYKDESEFTFSTLVTNILIFLKDFSTPARTAVYLWKSSLDLRNTGVKTKFVRVNGKITSKRSDDRYCVDTDFKISCFSLTSINSYLDELVEYFKVDRTIVNYIKISISNLNFKGSSNITDFLLVNRDTYFYNKLLNDAIRMLDAIHHGVHLEPQNEYRFKKALENTAKLFGILDFNERLKKGDLAVLGQVEKFIHENSEIL